ncbi:hypothetical protein Tco_1335582 [Tanacetum coccineum]
MKISLTHMNANKLLMSVQGFKEFKSDELEQWRLQTTLQAPLFKEKKGVRFSALYLQKKRNLLVFDHSHQQFSYFPMLVQSSSGSTSGPEPQLLTPGTISSRLVPNPPSPTPYFLWLLIQDSDPTVIPSGVEEEFYDIEIAHLDNDPLFGVPIPEPNSKESSLRNVIPTNVHSVNQPPEHLKK